MWYIIVFHNGYNWQTNLLSNIDCLDCKNASQTDLGSIANSTNSENDESNKFINVYIHMSCYILF